MPRLHEIAEYLNSYLRAATFPAGQSGTLRPTNRSVGRLGIALDPADAMLLPNVGDLDALLLHRWWGFDAVPLLPDAGVLGYHQPFDDRLTLSENPFLESLLGLSNTEPLHAADERVIGVIGDVSSCDAESMQTLLIHTFGGIEYANLPKQPIIRRVAAVNAMTAALVRDAHVRGADLYISGQTRVPATSAVAETGIGVIAIGHARLERWGLRCLDSLLHESWPDLTTVTTKSRS